MPIAPLIEVELDCEAGTPVDYRVACGLAESAVCTGALLELLLVSARELAGSPVLLSELVLSGHAPIGQGIRLLGRAYDRALEVIGGALREPQQWNGTHAAAFLATEPWTAARSSAVPASRVDVLDPCLLEHVCERAGGATVARWIVAAHRDQGGGHVRLSVDAAQLPDLEIYVLHPLLWEAGMSALDHLLSGPRRSEKVQRPDGIHAVAVSVYEPGRAPCSIEVLRTERGADVRWLDEDQRVIAEAGGVVLVHDAQGPAQRRCARIVEETLGKRVSDVHRPFAELGVSSIDRARVAAALAGDYRGKPALEQILVCDSLAQVSRLFAEGTQEAFLGDAERVAADPAARFVLSPAQQQVWALQAMAPDTPRCHVHVRLRCTGELDEAALRRALLSLLARHASLRVVLDVTGDEPLQRVLDAPRLALEVVDLSALDVAEQDSALLRYSATRSRELFDLEAGPLVRFALARLAHDRHTLLITAHHLIVDGFGLELMVRELLALYESPDAFGGQVFGLDRIARRYAPASAHQAAEPATSSSRDPARRVPIARDYDGTASGRGARAAIDLPQPLRAMAQREQVSLFALLCAAYSYVLARHAGQDEVVVGVVSAGRATLDELGAVGMFARSMPLRVAITDEASLLSLARDIHARAPQLVSEGGGSTDATPFAATILFQQWSHTQLRAGGLSVQLELDSPDGAPVGYSRSELELLAADHGYELGACLQYDPSVLHETTVGWLASAVGRVLEQTCRSPASTVRDAARAAPEHAVMMRGPTVPIDEPFVHRRIAEHAARFGDAVAVRDGFGRRLTFGSLVERATRAARALRVHGAQPGRCIGIVAERVADLPVAVLAVLESGAAYVPIDPSHPPERIEIALHDANVELVISLGSEAPRFERARTLDLETLVLEGMLAAPSDAGLGPGPADAAYVLHTSGSTGKPKGVVVEHASLASFVSAMEVLLPSTAQGPWLALTTLAFDISIVELLFSLAIGAEVRVGTTPSSRSGQADPFALLRSLGKGVKCFQCTPSLARLLLEDGDGRAFLEGLSVLLVGGESLPAWLARALCELVPGAVFNVYGPTETTVWSSAARLNRDDAWVPIGEPIANTVLCVVDEAGNDVSPGLSGELWIAGAGVARGYLQRPEETAKRFVTRQTPWGEQRFYRTGDLVRLRVRDGVPRSPSPANALEWLGRLDRQVKLAGNRIELGEVEGVLAEHPFTRECAVLVERAANQERLVAVVVPDVANAVDALTGAQARTGIFSQDELEGALMAWAAQKLPAYMIPSRTLFVDSLPRTASGKTDRQALAALAASTASASAQPLSETPVTREEKLLAGLWSEVLARPEIDRYDDFFALGGTSFAAVLLASRARKHGISLAPATVLAHPTLAEQALQITPVVVQREARALHGDVQLDGLAIASRAAVWPPQRVVLTGATGFLGAHLLVELQAALEVEVVCLVRAANDGAARERLERSVASWGLAQRVRWDLVRCMAADIAKPRFGLSEGAWQYLVEHSDLVVHNAAEVNFALSYEELKATNVGGTRTAIELAAQAKRKPLHYVSTIAITDAADPHGRVDEETPLALSERLTDGYSQSKWVAEGLVALAAERGLEARCYRAGPLILDRAPQGDAFAEALATVARTGIAFATKGRAIPHLSRVDDTARAIVTLALDRKRPNLIEHVVSPQRMKVSDLLNWVREWGFDVAELDDEAWLQRIDADAWASATMFVVSQRLRDGVALVPEVEHGATLVRLSSLGFTWREIDGVLIQRLLARLTDSARGAETS